MSRIRASFVVAVVVFTLLLGYLGTSQPPQAVNAQAPGQPTAGVQQFDVIVSRVGSPDRYFRSSGSGTANVKRGNALLAAMATCITGDTLKLQAGVFDIGAGHLDLSLAGTGTVHLVGIGMGLTTIRGSTLHGESYVHPGLDGCVIKNLTLTQIVIICSYTSGTTASSSAFTNAVFENLQVNGITDSLFVNHTSPCSGRGSNVHMTSGYDNYVSDSCATHAFSWHGCSFIAIRDPAVDNSGVCRAINPSSGTHHFFSTYFFAQQDGVTGATTVAVYCLGATVYLVGCHAESLTINDSDPGPVQTAIFTAMGQIYVKGTAYNIKGIPASASVSGSPAPILMGGE